MIWNKIVLTIFNHSVRVISKKISNSQVVLGLTTIQRNVDQILQIIEKTATLNTLWPIYVNSSSILQKLETCRYISISDQF